MFTAYRCAGLSSTWATLKDTCVSCQQVSVVNKCQLSTSVRCQQVSAVNRCKLSTSVCCQQVSAVSKCTLSTSVCCQQVSAVNKWQLSTSVSCQKVLAVNKCTLPINTGSCAQSTPRFGYRGGACIRFNYTGCGGNANKFMYVMCLFLLRAYLACTTNKYYE